MDHSVVTHLNTLTKKFYLKVADSFSRTRQTPWQGWSRALEIIKPFIHAQNISVLDVGCGNGRFLTFLNKSSASNISYLGIDENSLLLQQTKGQLHDLKVDGDVLLSDFITEVQNGFFSERFANKTFNVIASFGVFHHIPSKELRKKFIAELAALTAENGVLIISFWQFGQFARFEDKKLDPSKFDINPSDLEENDFLLGWDSDTTIARYCHSFSPEEINELVTTSGMQLLETFPADGREGKVNTYLVLQRIAQ
jgi:tRNA (uracil-5-)-methyltransferase TRM9